MNVRYVSGPILGAGVTVVSALMEFHSNRGKTDNKQIENLVVYARKNLNQRMGEYNSVCVVGRSHVILNWVVREAFSEEVSFKSGSEQPEELALWRSEAGVFQGGEVTCAKALKLEWIDLFEEQKEE